MANWTQVPLGDVFDVQLGKMLGAGSDNGDQYQYLANRNVQWGQIVIDELGTMNFSGSERKRYRLQYGDLLVCEGGEVGRAALWSDELPECYFQNALHRLRATSTADPSFMRHYFEFAAREGQFRGLTGQTSIGHLPRSSLVRWRIPVPPVEEQRRIAGVLDTIDEMVYATERTIVKLRSIQEGLFAEAVEVAFTAGRIRRLGEVVGLNSASLIQTGPFGSQLHASEYVDQGVPAFMPKDIKEGELDVRGSAKISASKANELGRHRLRSGDVLFARRGDLSQCAVVAASQAGSICGTGCLLVRIPSEELEPEWLVAAYRHDFVQRQVRARAVGSTMPNLSTGLIRSLAIPFPSEASQRIMAAVHDVSGHVETERANQMKLEAVRAGLAADLLSGRIRTVAV